MTYQVILRPQAKKSLSKIPKRERQRIEIAIDLLSTNPYPPASRKLVNRPEWRVRIGKYRILYEVIDNELVVLVISIGHRSEIYDK
ncbi:MAG: type II toxin-antitoxin system RelE/ParE family toxin [Actinobacteria bacterium]|nr:type II toxin-antitoxin system RelE/ParE family toxin [Actinomycetota bacterium]